MSAASARRKQGALLDCQRHLLELIASGAPLEEVLVTLVKLIEEQSGDMRCAVLLADSGQTRLRFVAAPNIPEDYRTYIEPYLAIAPNMGSCGTAAYQKQPVYTRDTATDRLWENCGDIAVRNGLRAIWSTPVLDDEERVLGTFAMYYGEPRLPTAEHVQLIDMAVQLARVAIEAKADDDLLRAIFDNSPNAVVVTDMDGRIARATRAFAAWLGYTPAALRGRMIDEIAEDNDAAVARRELMANGKEIWNNSRYRARDGRTLRARELVSVRRDPGGKPRYFLVRLDSINEAAADPVEHLSRREQQVLDLVVAGRTSKEIAAELGIAPGSVDTYRSRIMIKLGVGDIPALMRFAIRHGIATV